MINKKNHNIRFNLEKEEEKEAWDIFNSREIQENFRSKNEFVIKAITEYYKRYMALKEDPYLETREKEERFADRVVEVVEQKVLANIPQLLGNYMIQQHISSYNVSESVIPNITNNTQETEDKPIISEEETEDVDDNELLDFDLFG